MGSEAFTGDGFKTWKKGRERFKMLVGPVGSVHNKAREAATNLMNQATHIEMVVSKHSDQARKSYRTCLNASIKCTKFLLRQGFPFRGHDESATSSNRGNYLELLQFLADNNDKVREVVMENAPGNLKLLAPSIHKEIVNSCTLETLDAIMDGLKDIFFSILVDEACDVSVKEQMAMVLRYVDDNGHVIERFVGIQHVTNTTSSSLKDAINTLFSRNGLSISKLRGQGYDGASNMRVELRATPFVTETDSPARKEDTTRVGSCEKSTKPASRETAEIYVLLKLDLLEVMDACANKAVKEMAKIMAVEAYSSTEEIKRLDYELVALKGMDEPQLVVLVCLRKMSS
ncbi:uncharacterized protein LOC126596788 [Malus sylvestris]|uniref:uncharacterized protein LOC126596788 n=1 Tax=Malus sylvestris TaxID=3752 RepID=UPI0021AC88E2|nr:uncharacterized protein LOC126596788 [Malus sylvestris]